MFRRMFSKSRCPPLKTPTASRVVFEICERTQTRWSRCEVKNEPETLMCLMFVVTFLQYNECFHFLLRLYGNVADVKCHINGGGVQADESSVVSHKFDVEHDSSERITEIKIML